MIVFIRWIADASMEWIQLHCILVPLECSYRTNLNWLKDYAHPEISKLLKLSRKKHQPIGWCFFFTAFGGKNYFCRLNLTQIAANAGFMYPCSTLKAAGGGNTLRGCPTISSINTSGSPSVERAGQFWWPHGCNTCGETHKDTHRPIFHLSIAPPPLAQLSASSCSPSFPYALLKIFL